MTIDWTQIFDILQPMLIELAIDLLLDVWLSSGDPAKQEEQDD
jgi:hypothetical protein